MIMDLNALAAIVVNTVTNNDTFIIDWMMALYPITHILAIVTLVGMVALNSWNDLRNRKELI